MSKHFDMGSREQLERLLVIVNTKGEKRNWDWLIDWVGGMYNNMYDFEKMLTLYEDDEAWIHYPHG